MKRAATIRARFARPRDMAYVLGLPAGRAREIEREVEMSIATKRLASFLKTPEHSKNGTKSSYFRVAKSNKPGARKATKVSKRAKTAKPPR